jgi:hypothetical protein
MPAQLGLVTYRDHRRSNIDAAPATPGSLKCRSATRVHAESAVPPDVSQSAVYQHADDVVCMMSDVMNTCMADAQSTEHDREECDDTPLQ